MTLPRDPTQQRAGVVAVVFVLVCVMGLALWVSFGRTEAGRQRPPDTPGALSASRAAPTATGAGSPTTPGQVQGAPGGAGPGSLEGVDWAALDYQIGCAGTGTQVQEVDLADLDGGLGGDADAEALVTVRCAAGAGSPPSALLAFDAGPDAPRLVDRLVGTHADVLLTSVRVEGVLVRASGTTYSSPEVPRCCPDERFTGAWRWTGAVFEGTR